MTEIRVGVVDVYPVEHGPAGWQVLLLRRAIDSRSPGAWEVVHGRIEADETPASAAVRELAEETGLAPDRLYSISSHPFYVASIDAVLVAVTFAAIVSANASLRLGPEHDGAEWLPFAKAEQRATWPRTEEHLRWIAKLLHHGSAGPAEDVLRVG